MTSYVTPKKNTAFKFYVALVDQANTKLTKANPTIAAGDFKSSLDGGAFGNLATLPSANPASGRAVMIDLSAGEMNGDNIVVQCVDAAGAEWCDLVLNIQTTARQIDDLATPTNITAGTIATVSGNVNGNVAGSVGSVTGAVGSVTGLTASNLDATVSSRLASASYTAPDSAATIAAAVWATVIDGTNSAIKLMRGFAAALLGKASGLATTSAVYRNAPDSKDVITATVDADGNRTAVTLDLT